MLKTNFFFTAAAFLCITNASHSSFALSTVQSYQIAQPTKIQPISWQRIPLLSPEERLAIEQNDSKFPLPPDYKPYVCRNFDEPKPAIGWIAYFCSFLVCCNCAAEKE